MSNRLKPLTFQTTSLVLKELARFHAISIVMRAVDEKQFTVARESISEIVFPPEGIEMFSISLECSLRNALESLRANNRDGKLTQAISIIEKNYTGRLYEEMKKCVQSEVERGSEWLVIGHGDLWSNNLMFFPDRDNAESVKMIDLQASRCANLVLDILYFIYSSTVRELRDVHLNQLLQDYQQSLVDSIDQLAKDHKLETSKIKEIKKVFSGTNLKDKFWENSIFGLGIALWIVPALTFDPNNTPDLNSVTKDSYSEDASNMANSYSATYHSRIRDIVLEFHESGLLEDKSLNQCIN